MATTQKSDINSSVPDLVDFKFMKARYQAGIILNRISSKTDIVKKMGDQVTVNISEKLSTVAVTTATGAFTPTTLAPTSAIITIDTWRAVPFEITDQAIAQSGSDLVEIYSDQLASAEAEKIDTDILALYTGILAANVVGSADTPSPFDEDMSLPAMLFLADLNVPKSELSWGLPPIAFLDGLYKKDKWTAANMMGIPKSVLTTGFEFPIHGVPAYQTTLVATSGSVRKGVLFHKEWVGAGIQINGKRETYRGVANNKLVTGVVSQILYGVGTMRSDHAVVINIKAAKSTQ